MSNACSRSSVQFVYNTLSILPQLTVLVCYELWLIGKRFETWASVGSSILDTSGICGRGTAEKSGSLGAETGTKFCEPQGSGEKK